MAASTPTPDGDERPTLGALVATITRELSLLVRGEIDLAKAELQQSARNGARGGGLLAGAAVLLMMVGLLFTWAAVYGLTSGTGLPLWASFLIVGGVYLLIAVILGAVGVRALKKVKGPEQGVAEMQRTKEIMQGVVPNSPPVSLPSTAPLTAPPADARVPAPPMSQ